MALLTLRPKLHTIVGAGSICRKTQGSSGAAINLGADNSTLKAIQRAPISVVLQAVVSTAVKRSCSALSIGQRADVETKLHHDHAGRGRDGGVPCDSGPQVRENQPCGAPLLPQVRCTATIVAVMHGSANVP